MAYFKCNSIRKRHTISIDGNDYNDNIILKSVRIDGLSVSTLPYEFAYGSAVVYNNEIHILGGYDYAYGGGNTKHYKYDGSTWTNVSILPCKFAYGSTILINNEIHILGGGNNVTINKHYIINITVYEIER